MSNKKFKYYLLIVIAIFHIYAKDTSLKDPKDPAEPTVFDLETKNFDKNGNLKFNLEYQKQNGIIYSGIAKDLTGFYLKLTWAGNEKGTQEVLIDFVKSIAVIGYSKIEKKNKNLMMIYYYPSLFDIELTNGTSIKKAKGRIKELDSFVVYNKIGKEKCFTYFIRYWLEDKQMFYDNNSKDYNEKPFVPDNTVIYVKFLDRN